MRPKPPCLGNASEGLGFRGLRSRVQGLGSPTPKIRTVRLSYDGYRVLILGVGVTIPLLLSEVLRRFAGGPCRLSK